MTRRVTVAMFFLVLCATAAWPKWKEEEQKYLDDHFNAIQDQIQALATQVQTLNSQLAELRQNQGQLQAVVIRQQRALQELDDMVKSMRIGGEENFSNLKSAINQLRSETQSAFNKLTGQTAAPGAGTPEVATAPKAAPAAPSPQAVQGYILDVSGNNVKVGLGSAQGIHQGSRLVVFKAADQSTRVGVIEITQVVDGENSLARIVTVNSGVRLEFSDIVRAE
jgi:outer membrane murein-binding lipoprotein Lpp